MRTPVAAGLDPYRGQLQRVLESESLRRCESLRRLLSYLAERSLSHSSEELKEYTVGLEVFGRPASYDPQKDASVRVQMSRLRQKLVEYRKTEGFDDPYCLELPKGRFTVLFLPGSGQEPGAGTKAARPAIRTLASSPAGFLAALILLSGLMCFTVLLWRKVDALESKRPMAAAEAANESNPLWPGFFNPAVSNMLVFGSPPFFASSAHHLFVRMYRATNPDDARSSPNFREMDRKIGPLQGPRFDYASMGDAIGAQRLTAYFGSYGIVLHALPAHLAVWDSLQDSNVIFLGAVRMNPLLRRLPVRQDFELGSDNSIHNLNPKPGEQAVYDTPSNHDALTYAVIGSFPGLKPDRSIVVIAAHSSPGVVGAVDFATSPEGLRVIREKLKLRRGEHKHFQVLLRIYSDNDAPVKTEYVTDHINP